MKVIYECFECGEETYMRYDESVTGIPLEAHVGKVIEGMCAHCKSNKIWIRGVKE